jgi:osmotically-inducible protein OsmY
VTGDQREPPHYVAERVRAALAADPRLNDLGIQVKIIDRKIILSGAVATQERQAMVETIVRELLPDHDIQNEVGILEIVDPPAPERVR